MRSQGRTKQESRGENEHDKLWHLYTFMAYAFMADTIMADTVMAYKVMAYIVMAYTDMAYIYSYGLYIQLWPMYTVMVDTVMAYAVTAYTVMTYTVMAWPTQSCTQNSYGLYSPILCHPKIGQPKTMTASYIIIIINYRLELSS